MSLVFYIEEYRILAFCPQSMNQRHKYRQSRSVSMVHDGGLVGSPGSVGESKKYSGQRRVGPPSRSRDPSNLYSSGCYTGNAKTDQRTGGREPRLEARLGYGKVPIPSTWIKAGLPAVTGGEWVHGKPIQGTISYFWFNCTRIFYGCFAGIFYAGKRWCIARGRTTDCRTLRISDMRRCRRGAEARWTLAKRG